MAKGFAENQDLTSEIVNLLKNLSLEKSSYEYTARISLSAYVLDVSKNIHGTVKDLVHLRGEAFAHRDECMSDLTLHFAGEDKTILWAHNYHVSRPSEKLVEGVFYQGQFLKRILNERYKAIAFTAGRIDINWPWLPKHMKGPSLPENSLEKAVTDRFPHQSAFLTSIENIECANYCQEFSFDQDGDISARFDGLIVLPESGPIEYATDID
jgi:erythromycin esterase-like protein